MSFLAKKATLVAAQTVHADMQDANKLLGKLVKNVTKTPNANDVAKLETYLTSANLGGVWNTLKAEMTAGRHSSGLTDALSSVATEIPKQEKVVEKALKLTTEAAKNVGFWTATGAEYREAVAHLAGATPGAWAKAFSGKTGFIGKTLGFAEKTVLFPFKRLGHLTTSTNPLVASIAVATTAYGAYKGGEYLYDAHLQRKENKMISTNQQLANEVAMLEQSLGGPADGRAPDEWRNRMNERNAQLSQGAGAQIG